MPRHKDFEIWYDEETQRYRFSVEYWGSYGAKTLKEIQEKRNKVRGAVKQRLKEIDRQNKEYYKRLEQKEAQLKLELKRAKQNSCEDQYVKYKNLSASERVKLLRLITDGADELTIKEKIPVNSGTIAAIRTKIKKEENVRTNIQKHEVLRDSGRCRIIMPTYSADIGRRRLSDE